MDDDGLAVTSRGLRPTRVIWLTCLVAAFTIGAATTGLSHPGHVVATIAGVASALMGISAFTLEHWPPKLLRWVTFVVAATLVGSVGLLLRTLLQAVLARVG